jgi:hypothetical protein
MGALGEENSKLSFLSIIMDLEGIYNNGIYEIGKKRPFFAP